MGILLSLFICYRDANQWNTGLPLVRLKISWMQWQSLWSVGFRVMTRVLTHAVAWVGLLLQLSNQQGSQTTQGSSGCKHRRCPLGTGLSPTPGHWYMPDQHLHAFRRLLDLGITWQNLVGIWQNLTPNGANSSQIIYMFLLQCYKMGTVLVFHSHDVTTSHLHLSHALFPAAASLDTLNYCTVSLMAAPPNTCESPHASRKMCLSLGLTALFIHSSLSDATVL